MKPSGLANQMAGQLSRLAIHIGTHLHSQWQVFSRDAVKKVLSLIRKHHSENPLATPGRLKNVACGSLLADLVDGDSVEGIGPEEETEVWESLKVISTPHKFAVLLRSIKWIVQILE